MDIKQIAGLFLLFEAAKADLYSLFNEEPVLKTYDIFFLEVSQVAMKEVIPQNVCLMSYGVSLSTVSSTFIYTLANATGPIITIDQERGSLNCNLVVITKSVQSLQHLHTDFPALWTLNKCYLILLTENTQQKLVASFLRNLWKSFRIVNVLVVNTNDLNKVLIFNPFIGASGKIFALNADKPETAFQKIRSRITDMHLHPLRVAMFYKPITAEVHRNGTFGGTDGAMLKMFAKVINCTPVLTGPKDSQRYGFRSPNGTYYGLLGDLVYNRADIAFNEIFLKDYKAPELDFTTPVHSDKLCIVVPEAVPPPQYMVIFLSFKREIWYCIFLTYILTLMIWHFMRQVADNSVPRDISNLAFTIFRLFLTASYHRTVSRYSERIFIISSILFGFIISRCFECSMVDVLTNPLNRREINSLEALDESGLPIYVRSHNLWDLFAADNNPTMASLRGKMQVELKDESVLLLDRVAYTRDIATVGRHADLITEIASTYIFDNAPLLHIVRECPRTYHIAYLVPKGSPYFKCLNKVIVTSVESGIISSWFINRGSMQPLSVRFPTKSTSKLHVFTLGNLKIAFLILLSGLSLSFTSFLLEILSAYFALKMNSTNMISHQ